MDFSVVVTNYNYGRFLEEAVGSALAQRLAPREVLVVDDGSTDDSRERLAALARRSPLVQPILQENSGQASAFLAGVRAARGRFVAFLDADDAWTEGYLERVAQILGLGTGIDFVYTGLQLFGEREGPFRAGGGDRDLGLSVLHGAFNPQYQGSATSATTVSRELALRILDLPPELQQDWRTRADDCLAYGGDVLGAHKYYCAEPLARYRAHGANVFLGQERETLAELLHQYRRGRLLHHYRQVAGITPDLLPFAKREFRTKPAPTRRDLRHYLELAGRAPLGWLTRLEHKLGMLRHYWSTGARRS